MWPLLALAFLALAFPAHAIEGTARVIDGDTIAVGGKRIRLQGIDAPEARQKCTRSGSMWRCGWAATAALRGFLGGQRVQCTGQGRDRNKRLVAVCRVNGEDIGAWMVRHGWALDYRRYSKGRYAAEEAEAKAARRGLWAGTFTEPWEWREDR